MIWSVYIVSHLKFYIFCEMLSIREHTIKGRFFLIFLQLLLKSHCMLQKYLVISFDFSVFFDHPQLPFFFFFLFSFLNHSFSYVIMLNLSFKFFVFWIPSIFCIKLYLIPTHGTLLATSWVFEGLEDALLAESVSTVEFDRLKHLDLTDGAIKLTILNINHGVTIYRLTSMLHFFQRKIIFNTFVIWSI